ncbi:MAG: TlpA family protein disulfide reductase [Prevotellaceae bacterium]|nr:TlpA family protein disulfide reductase [Prevotellaceae bacterium]
MNKDGSFVFEEVPMQCNYAIRCVVPKIQYDEFYVFLTSGKETKMDIIYEETTGRLKSIHQTDSLGLTSTDLINVSSVSSKLHNYGIPRNTGPSKTQDEFIQRLRIVLKSQLKRIEENKTNSNYEENIDFSECAKTFLVNDRKIFMLDWQFFNFGKGVENLDLPDFNIKYFTYLKEFDLNNPQYLYAGNYYSLLQKILSDKTLNIPPIGETPIDEWLKGVTKILSKFVGFKKGLFYDMLIANSYAQQFDQQVIPLSEKQKENIRNYFKGEKSEFAKILLKKDNEVRALAAEKEALVVNETPAIPWFRVMDEIVAKYKGNVVVVDFWATWCAPCLNAIKQSTAIKAEFKDRGVVFVYISNPTSPRAVWENRIIGIGGEHYYLEPDEWEYILDTFDFTSIPTYLFFDINGKFVEKYSSYPGDEKMREAIEKLLS